MCIHEAHKIHMANLKEKRVHGEDIPLDVDPPPVLKTPFELGISLEQSDAIALTARIQGVVIGGVISAIIIPIAALWGG